MGLLKKVNCAARLLVSWMVGRLLSVVILDDCNVVGLSLGISSMNIIIVGAGEVG